MLYQFALIFFLLFLIAYLLVKRGGKSLLKAFFSFLFIIFAVSTAFIVDNLHTEHVAQAVESVKGWIRTPDEKENAQAAENGSLPIIKLKKQTLIDAPVIPQFPELARGCEVTSLAMLLQHAGVDTDKMVLAKEIKKNPAQFKESGGKIYFGDPHDGFVGDIYTFNKPGLGVYHKPIKQLAESYLPGQVYDITGSDFQELKIHLSDSRPVWVIINAEYKKLPDSYFQTWHTPNGEIRITFKEHSVLVTGYDQDFVYFNDPLTGLKNKKAPMKDFEDSWVQMGRQAITYLPD